MGAIIIPGGGGDTLGTNNTWTGTNTFSANVSVTGTASATAGSAKIINSNASAVGMAAMFSNLSANNAANAAEMGFSMNNSTPAEVQFGAIRVTSTTVTAASEQGTMIFRTLNAGTMVTMAQIDNNGLTLTGANGSSISTLVVKNNGASANNSPRVFMVDSVAAGTSSGGPDILWQAAAAANMGQIVVNHNGGGGSTMILGTRTNGGALTDALTIASTQAVSLSGMLAVSAVYSSGNGIFVQNASTNNAISTGSQGAASTTLFIGNASITVVSDERVKTDIQDYDADALGLVNGLRVIEYGMPDEYRPFGGYKGRYVGFAAQHLHQVAPWTTNTQGGADCQKCLSGQPCKKHPTWQSRYELLSGVFARAIQQLDAKVERLAVAA